MAFAARPAPGWRPTARPRCGSRSTRARTTSAGAAATPSSSPRRSACGASAWRERGWTVPDWPTRVRRRRSRRRDEAQGPARGDGGARAAARRCDSFGIWMLGPALLKYGTEEQKTRAPAEDRARRDPLVPGLFRAQCRLRPRLAGRRAPRTTATTSSSTARRSGPPTPTRPTGSSAWCAPTPRRRSTPASASCCSTWRRPA